MVQKLPTTTTERLFFFINQHKVIFYEAKFCVKENPIIFVAIPIPSRPYEDMPRMQKVKTNETQN